MMMSNTMKRRCWFRTPPVLFRCLRVGAQLYGRSGVGVSVRAYGELGMHRLTTPNELCMKPDKAFPGSQLYEDDPGGGGVPC